MKSVYDVIIRPVITEQSMEATELKKYVFLVAESANKTEIKLALESTENGVAQSVGSLSVNVETVVPETAPAHVTGTPLTTEQLLQLFAQLAQ